MARQEPIFKFYRGDDYALSVTVKDKDDQVVDIDGWIVTFTMKRNPHKDDSTAALQVSTTADSSTNPIGNVILMLPHDQTKDLKPGEYYFDIEAKIANSTTTVLVGIVEVMFDVTWGA